MGNGKSRRVRTLDAIPETRRSRLAKQLIERARREPGIKEVLEVYKDLLDVEDVCPNPMQALESTPIITASDRTPE
jgi:hypothetical protein